MAGFTEQQVEEMIQEAVAKTEQSFGGTFKRLKSENEELQHAITQASAQHEAESSGLKDQVSSLEHELSDSRLRISELAIRGEIQRQLRESGPLPDEFLDIDSIRYSEDPDTLRAQVAHAIEKGRKSLEKVLTDIGVGALPDPDRQRTNPTNPPRRDTRTARELKRTGSQTVLKDMMRRGLIR